MFDVKFHTAPTVYTLLGPLPGYLPPLFLLMKHTMSRTRMRRAMAHMRPMNQPCVAMSTCLLAMAVEVNSTQLESVGSNGSVRNICATRQYSITNNKIN